LDQSAAAAGTGERNPERLCEIVLTELQKPQLSLVGLKLRLSGQSKPVLSEFNHPIPVSFQGHSLGHFKTDGGLPPKFCSFV
jgi:hypothetical protein